MTTVCLPNEISSSRILSMFKSNGFEGLKIKAQDWAYRAKLTPTPDVKQTVAAYYPMPPVERPIEDALNEIKIFTQIIQDHYSA